MVIFSFSFLYWKFAVSPESGSWKKKQSCHHRIVRKHSVICTTVLSCFNTVGVYHEQNIIKVGNFKVQPGFH